MLARHLQNNNVHDPCLLKSNEEVTLQDSLDLLKLNSDLRDWSQNSLVYSVTISPAPH